ncbi:MAG: Bacterial alpha-L-rhamnosidase [Chloroflexi bacterium ADurb.Bin325]|nr:MAG: Bacterial alpha-L-rhamnosidase [Chloroflexi bacterium ADurb.Bin325]
MHPEVTPQDFPDVRWNGHWIWVAGEQLPRRTFMPEPQTVRREARGFFRKTFHLDRVPERVPARITADSRYLLFVNGQEVFRGPIRSQPRRLTYDLFDLAPYLRAGENTIAVFVVYYGSPRSFWQPAIAAGTLGQVGMMVFEADLGPAHGWLVSDTSWRTLKSDAWSEDWKKAEELPVMFGDAIPTEVVDARRLPFGWEQPGFDDSAWGAAQLLRSAHPGSGDRTTPPSDPYGPLHPRPIGKLGGDLRTPASVQGEYLAAAVDPNIGDPMLRVQTAIPFAVAVPAGGSARVTFDMGGIVMGQVQFEVHAPAGTVFDFAYTEDPIEPPRRGGFGGMHAGTRYVARGENDRFKLYDALGFRYAYVLVHGAAGPVTLDSFAVQEDVYQWQPGAEFACSDDELNRIFRAGIRTVQLNSRDAFTDCPTREQQAWVGDSVVHQMVHLATNTDWRLAWQYLNLSNSPRYDGILPMTVVGASEASGGITIPDWPLHWVHGVYNLYRFLGDEDAVKELMPSVERVLRWFAPFQTSQGVLKDIIEWALVDWSAVSNSDTSAIYTALWARGLKEFAEIAGWLEEKASQRWAERLYAKARAGFEAFWDEARGSYVDHIVDGEVRPEMSQIAGAAAIVSGLAPQERWSRIIETITDPARLIVQTWTWGGDAGGTEGAPFGWSFTPRWDVHNQIIMAEPFMQYLVHDAIALSGHADRLPDLYPRWSQFLTGGYDTIGEDWRHGTHVHGWSCTPTKDLVFYTLGVTPDAPGYAAARIAPRLGRLDWARGKIPTPHGLITVEATHDSVTVDSPVPLIVDLPGRDPMELPPGQHNVR